MLAGVLWHAPVADADSPRAGADADAAAALALNVPAGRDAALPLDSMWTLPSDLASEITVGPDLPRLFNVDPTHQTGTGYVLVDLNMPNGPFTGEPGGLSKGNTGSLVPGAIAPLPPAAFAGMGMLGALALLRLRAKHRHTA